MTTGAAAGAAPRVTVVGGGLAGIGAALDCADAGAEVTLIERRRRLGGLTWSYEHEGRWVDNGQHVFLRCCSAYLGFLDRIGSAGDVHLQDRLDVTVLRPPADPCGQPASARLRRSALPAPLHLGASLLAYRHLSVAERLRLPLAALPLGRANPDDPRLEDETFGSWLGRHGQSAHAVEALWDLITVATVNLPAAQASAAMGAMVFRTGLLTDPGAGDIGWARIPLGQLHGERAGTALAKAGVKVVSPARVEGVEAGPDGPRVLAGGEPLGADAVILAVPHTEVSSLAPAAFPAGDPADLGTSPIVDVHVTFDRPVTDRPLLAAVDSPLQWIFDRTESSGLAPGGAGPGGPQYLAVSLSAAEDHVGTRPDRLAETVVGELRRILPDARRAEVTGTFVTKERAATFRASPGARRLRPGPRTPIPGIYVAGAWTDTGWPATMEGALRSGRKAARAALTGAGITRDLPEEVA